MVRLVLKKLHLNGDVTKKVIAFLWLILPPIYFLHCEQVGYEIGMHIEASCWINSVLINKEGFKFHIAISNHIHVLIACICYYSVIIK